MTMSQLAFYVNTDLCISCKCCGVACKDKNDLALGRKYRRIFSESAGSWSIKENGTLVPDGVFSYSVSIGCNHCAMPLCMAACPVQAITKRDDGIVYIDQELCIGCGECATACPYEVPSLDAEASVYGKCDFCMDLIDIGETPACLMACPMYAIEYGELDELKAQYPDAVQQVSPLADPSQSQPSLLIKPHRRYTAGVETTNCNMPEEIRAND
jgi:anaerobic dimethyl sulfoxide reductase subunit B (iron-sulfur subunit)